MSRGIIFYEFQGVTQTVLLEDSSRHGWIFQWYGLTHDPIFYKNWIGTYEILMDEFSSNTVQLMTQKTEILENFPDEFFRICQWGLTSHFVNILQAFRKLWLLFFELQFSRAYVLMKPHRKFDLSRLDILSKLTQFYICNMTDKGRRHFYRFLFLLRFLL